MVRIYGVGRGFCRPSTPLDDGFLDDATIRSCLTRGGSHSRTAVKSYDIERIHLESFELEHHRGCDFMILQYRDFSHSADQTRLLHLTSEVSVILIVDEQHRHLAESTHGSSDVDVTVRSTNLESRLSE